MESRLKRGISGSGPPTRFYNMSWKRRHSCEDSVRDDETFSFIFRPHTFSSLLILLGFLSYVAFSNEEIDDFNTNVKRGLYAVAVVFVAFGVTYARDGPFYRPHPIIWRFLFSCCVLYELVLIFFLFQTPKMFRQAVQFLDPKLNRTITETAYGDTCNIYDPENYPDDPWKNVKGKMDGFVVAHAVGWFCKTLIIRDFWMTNVLSVTFEFLEYSLEHQLPNFSECWWDHWILDVLICNFGGIWLGNKALKVLENKEYNWIGIRNQMGYKNKMRRVIAQFSPYSWVSFAWKPNTSIRRWVSVNLIIIFVLICELNTFYLKFVMWAPPEHPMVLGRMWFVAAAGAVAIREAYDFLMGVTADIGQSAWIAVAVIITEFLICIKFGWETVTMPFPLHIKWFWFFLSIGYIMWSFWDLWKVDIVTEPPEENQNITERAVSPRNAAKSKNE